MKRVHQRRALERLLRRARGRLRAPWLLAALLDRERERDELRHPPLAGFGAEAVDERDEGECDEESREARSRATMPAGEAQNSSAKERWSDLARAVGPAGLA